MDLLRGSERELLSPAPRFPQRVSATLLPGASIKHVSETYLTASIQSETVGSESNVSFCICSL